MRWCFGEFMVDRDARQLTRRSREIHLSPKAFDLLCLLIEKQPNVVAKTDLIEHLWPGTFVVEANLSNLIAEIRSALKDRARAPKFLRTNHGVGYAFCGDATAASSDQPTTRNGVSCWIEWGKVRFPLPSGEHVIGRDPDVAVRLDCSTVSRRHARLMVSGDKAILEDFGSKNGTYVGDARVTSPRALRDGDGIRIGSLLVTYHVKTTGNSTDSYASRAR